MPFYIKQGDITTLSVDAIVNAANSSLLGGGGVDGAIHRAAGPELREYCAGLGGCETGEAKLSPGFRLPAKWIVHTVGPVWYGGNYGEEELLAACYRNSLALALEAGCASVAFPLISAGAYGYPKDQALAVAVREIKAFLEDHELEVTLVIYSRGDFRLPERLYAGVQTRLDRLFYYERYAALQQARWDGAQPSFSGTAVNAGAPKAAARPPVQKEQKKVGFFTWPGRKKEKEHTEAAREETLEAEADFSAAHSGSERPRSDEGTAPYGTERPRDKEDAAPRPGAAPMAAAAYEDAESLDQRLKCLDESFSEMLLRKIDEKGLTDAACYKRANVDRKLFSKIRSDPHYRPSKPTAIAFAVALELPLPEARELLMKAGFALSHSNKFDVIIEYFIANGSYDIFEINETLFAFDQNLLGA